MRASDYNIYLELPGREEHLLLHGYTGSVDLVSKKVVQSLTQPHAAAGVEPATVKRLVQRGYLTDRTPRQEREHVARLANALHRRHRQGMGLLIAPTLSCQLRCVYCYEKDIVCDPKRADAVMNMEQAGLVYAAIDAIAREKKRQPDEVTLYGGEPLLAENKDIVRYIVEEARSRGLHVRAITNGYDLPAYDDLLREKQIVHLQITLDGPELVHNKRRVAKGGRPTFARVCDSVQLAIDHGCRVSVRTNVDADNVEHLVALNNLYHERGWIDSPSFSAYANVTHDWREEKMLKPMELLSSVEKQFSRQKKGRTIAVNLGIDQVFAGLFRENGLPSLRPYFCGANIGSYIFCPDGHIYTCWDEVGRREASIGRYTPALEWFSSRANDWTNRQIANIPECLECAYALLCGGGCGVQAKKQFGTLLAPFCHQFKETFEFLVPRIYGANPSTFGAPVRTESRPAKGEVGGAP